jgi:hypothetical protein
MEADLQLPPIRDRICCWRPSKAEIQMLLAENARTPAIVSV